MAYDHRDIEKKWQKKWKEDEPYRSTEDKDKKKAYVLDMFPYPSGEGLHVGHPRGYIATDIYSRLKRMQGYSVLHPMGWDAFGLPAENYALKNKIHPRVAVEKNIANFKQQLAHLGFDYDWSREIDTTDPAYYHWTQWIFLKMLENKLAFQSNEPINWCPSCMTGLANEDLDGAVCERCGNQVVKKNLPQWVLKITDYADRMLADLDTLNWPEHIKEAQRNWIGRSEGAEISFPIAQTGKPNFLILHGYTGRTDKNFIPWFKKELEDQGFEVQAPQMPNTDSPVESEQVDYVIKNCRIDEHTIIVGHSLGAVVAIKVLQKLNRPIAGLILVAPAVEPTFRTGEPRPFWKTFTWDYDYKKIKSLTGFQVILSDSLEAEHRLPYLKHLAENLQISLVEDTAQKEHFTGVEEPAILGSLDLSAFGQTEKITVFTTRPDTLYGATYLVLAPEHPLVQSLAETSSNKDEILRYIVVSQQKTEIERGAEGKEKTGVKLEGVFAINPATKEELPVYVADYVLASYGTGAVMAVPAHDERDYEFAQKMQLPIRQVIVPEIYQSTEPGKFRSGEPFIIRDGIIVLVKHWSEDKYIGLKWKKVAWGTLVTGGIDEGFTTEETVLKEIREETGFLHPKIVQNLGVVDAFFYHVTKKSNQRARGHMFVVQLEDDEREQISEDEDAIHEIKWLTPNELANFLTADTHKYALELLTKRYEPYVGAGALINSGEFNGKNSDGAKWDITKAVGGKRVTRYKLRDWVFSRQRYWGEPIPVIHCEKDGAVPVPYEDLPVVLPDVESYEPTGTGESPLAAIESWVNTTCPKCGGPAKRETNTMPQWAGSSWYYLRFMDPNDKTQLVSTKNEKYWAPVDVYVGGDHAVRHLIYARFWHKFLYDIGVVSTKEPFARLEFLGFILAEDGRKMSKRYGNVINPDDVVAQYGADAFRIYEMFMGPFENTTSWSTASIAGTARFVERLWRMQELVVEHSVPALDVLLHETIRKIGNDIETFKFNTAVSQLMILLNAIEKEKAVGREQWSMCLRILAPFAPHITEELWERIGETDSIHLASWPEFDESLLAASETEVTVQVNGKRRGSITLTINSTEADAVNAARKLAPVVAALGGKKPKRVIYVAGRILNFVVPR